MFYSSEIDLFLSNKSNLNENDRLEVQETAISTLKLCQAPNEEGNSKTILCMGYVQSGKTMAFEAVMAAGKDLGYKLFIVLAGVSNNLLQQSIDRIEADFRLKDTNLTRRWVRFTNPNNQNGNELLEAINNINDSNTLNQKAIIITILKHSSHIKKLAEILAKNKNSLPTLIIDDEADQAGLNTRVNVKETKDKKNISTTHDAILKLRKALKSHSYLQYTATPQAPLLLHTLNELSPNYVKLLEPGKGYIGGKTFFQQNSPYIKVLDKNEIEKIKEMPVPENEEEIMDYSDYIPPSSFINALQTYISGLAIEIKRKDRKLTGNRSMLIHPDRETKKHTAFTKLTEYLVKEWKTTLIEKKEGYSDLIDSFLKVLGELKTTCNVEFNSSDDFVEHLKYALKEIAIKEVNAASGKTPQIDWSQHYAFILIGGMALDRGFTVEGLTVTYMPRSIGGGNIDSIQQRARFFGYKKAYLDLCRIYLDEPNKDLYEGYVIHEEGVRKSLKEFSEIGRPLHEWNRVFWLSSDLQACRRNVIHADSVHLARSNSRNPWFYPDYIYGDQIQTLENNKLLVKEFLESNKTLFTESVVHPKTGEVLVTSCILKLADVHADLLASYSNIFIKDQVKYVGYLFQIDEILNRDRDALCCVYNLTPNLEKPRTRIVQVNGKSSTQQGQSEKTKEFKRGEIHPGDTKLVVENLVTIHLSNIDTYDKDKHSILFEGNQVVSIRIPKQIEENDWYSQMEKRWRENQAAA